MKIFIIVILLISCGSPSVEIDKDQYTPKIVFDAYLITGQAIQNMNLMFGLKETEGLRLKSSIF